MHDLLTPRQHKRSFSNMAKELPNDAVIELAVIGTVIQYPSKFNDIAKYIVSDKVWYDSRCKVLWNVLAGMIRRREHIDLMTVTSTLTDDDYIQKVDNVFLIDCTESAGTESTIEIYAKKIYEKYLLRLVVDYAGKIEQTAMDNKVDALDVLVSAHTSIGELISLRPDSSFDINEALGDAIESIQNTDKLLIKTGFINVDKFAGGLTRGEITIVGGRPGHGKSTMLLNLLSNILAGKRKVILFNRELTNVEVLKKLIALESGRLSYTMIRQGIYDMDQLQELDRVREFIAKKYCASRFRMYDQIRDFPTSATEIKKFKPDVIVDDYIQLITPSGKEEQRRLQLERIVNDYKWIAKEYNCSVILASQLNRALETRGTQRPQLSDLAESGAIEQVAENVFFVFYPYKAQGGSPDQKNELTLVAAKVRYGETGSIKMAYDGDKCKMYNSEDELFVPPLTEAQQDEIPF
jgi:replicative DNA helicase